jgi:hypothetical protein
LRFKEKEHPETGEIQNTRSIWNSKVLYGHWFFNETPENIQKEQPIVIVQNPDPVNRTFGVGYYGAPFEGILTGDIEPLPVILARASEVKVRENKELIGSSECYVIDARGQDGKYTVWIDPEHGYNVIQAEVTKTGNDYVYGTQMGNVTTMPITGFKFSIKNVHLEQIKEHWIPMEGDFFIETSQGDSVSRTKRHHKRTSVELNPDFEKLGAFVPNIPNGTPILIMEAPGIHYTWQDGKPVSNIDQEFLKSLDESVSTALSEMNPKSSIADVAKNASDSCKGSENKIDDPKLNSAAGNIKKIEKSPVTKKLSNSSSPAPTILAACSLLAVAFVGLLIYSKYKGK